MGGWYERAVEQVEQDLADGVISNAEYHKSMRDINDESRQEAEDAAAAAYDDVIGGWS